MDCQSLGSNNFKIPVLAQVDFAARVRPERASSFGIESSIIVSFNLNSVALNGAPIDQIVRVNVGRSDRVIKPLLSFVCLRKHLKYTREKQSERKKETVSIEPNRAWRMVATRRKRELLWENVPETRQDRERE